MTTWLNGIVGETAGPIVSLVVSIILIVIAVFVLIWLVRMLLSGRFSLRHNPDLRLQVVDATAIDNRRKLVLVRRDNVEHLIVIGGQNDLVVESGIGAPVSTEQRAPQRTVAQPSETRAPAPARPAKRPVADRPAPTRADIAMPTPTPAPPKPAQPAARPAEVASIDERPPLKPAIAPVPAPSQQVAPTPKAEKPAAPDVEIASSADTQQELDAEMDALLNTLTTKNG